VPHFVKIRDLSAVAGGLNAGELGELSPGTAMVDRLLGTAPMADCRRVAIASRCGMTSAMFPRPFVGAGG
jgi:hypothetical protein